MQNMQKPVRERGFEADFAYGPPDVFLAAGHIPPAGRLYVDRFGREREDTVIMEGAERVMASVNIWDAVAGKVYDLDPIEKRFCWKSRLIGKKGARIWRFFCRGL